jgi:hypothetical protein
LLSILIELQARSPYSYGLSVHANMMPSLSDWNTQLRQIYERTGWTYKEARQRLYFVNHHMEADFRYPYHWFETAAPNYKPAGRIPDGFIVSIARPLDISYKDWLVKQPIQKDLRDAIVNGDIVLADNDQTVFRDMVPYYVVHRDKMPDHFHDYGLAYDESPAQEFLARHNQAAGSVKLGEEKVLFIWNECRKLSPYCATGMVVELKKSGSSRLSVKAEILGASLAQSSKFIHPDWTEAWISPFVEITCRSGKKEKLVLASSVGLNRAYEVIDPNFNFAVGNNSVLAPYAREFEFDCAGGVKEIRAGREATHVEQVVDMQTLHPPDVTFRPDQT